MAVCEYCEQEMHTADGCVKMPVTTIDGDLDPIPYGSESRDEPPKPGQRHHGVLIGDPPRCHDCCALPGHYHHVGCDWEECPRCHGQLISCDCDPADDDAPDGGEPENIEVICHDCSVQPAQGQHSCIDCKPVTDEETDHAES